MLRSVKESVLPITGRMIILAILVAGCSGDNPSRPDSNVVVTIENIWPVDVGRYWVYDMTNARYDGGATVYERAEDVPGLPDMEDLYAELQAGPPGAALESNSARMGYSVTANLTTDPDTTVMALEYYAVDPGVYASVPLGLTVGPIWRRSSDTIDIFSGGYLQWVHLDGALTPGHGFSTQLVDGLADGIFLHSRVWRIRSFDVMGKAHSGCVECFYVLDTGIQQSVDENGQIAGYFRAYSYGVVIYAPEVGPVYCKEQSLLVPDNVIQDDFGALKVREAVLEEYGVTE